MEPIKLILVEDNSLIVAAWRRMLRETSDVSLHASLDRADNLVAIARESRADVVILDLSMPGADAMDVLADLTRACPRVKTIMYTGRNRSDFEEKAKLAGAVAWVDKLDSPVQILATIRNLVRTNTTSSARGPMTSGLSDGST